MLTLRVDEKTLTFEFKSLDNHEILFREIFDHKDAKQIAEDILTFLEHFKKTTILDPNEQ